MTEEVVEGTKFDHNTCTNEGNKTNETDERSTLTFEAIENTKDALSAMELAEDHGINIDELDSVDEIQTRLKCHLTLIQEGNLKHKMDNKIKELGEKDITKKQNLSRIIQEVKNIFSQDTNKHQDLMEDLLNKDGTTDDIRHDCDLRLDSLKEKECVILVSGESSAGKSSLLNLLLGEDILPSHMLPCTSCITVIRYNPRKCAKILFKNGKEESIPNLDKEGLQRLQQRAYFSNATSGADEQQVYQARREEHGIAEIQVYLPITMLESGLVLVDTPGIGENEFLENYLMEYIRSHQILGFVYIIMTDNALGIAEDRIVNLMSLIIKSQKSSNDIVKFNPKAALFVCNRWDMVPHESKKAVREKALKQLEKSWPEFDSSNAVFFSTFKAKKEISVNEGYITEEYVALLYCLMKLYEVSLDKRIKASYRWIGTVLQRSIHYLETMFRRLDMNDKERQRQTQQVNEKLRTLGEKADSIIMSLYNEMEVAVEDISHQVRNYLLTTQAKTKLTSNWGQKEGELPDLHHGSGTWPWIKRQIDAAFDDRLIDLLEEWDEQAKIIQTLEKKLFREAKLNLCDLESDLADVEGDVQQKEKINLYRATTISLFTGLCHSLENFEDEGLLDNEMPKKLTHRLKLFMTRAIRRKHNETKLKEYKHNPSKVAQIRSEKLHEVITKNKDDRLELFVRDFLQRPYNYIKRLESKIPGLITSNITLLERFESEFLAVQRCRTQYENMLVRIEMFRKELIKYGEVNFSVSDFEEKDVKIHVRLPKGEQEYRERRSSISALMKNAYVMKNSCDDDLDLPHGLWYKVHSGEITKGSETRHVAVKIYSTRSDVENILVEIAKLRCLMHVDVCIAEFLGVFHQKDTPTPALLFAGKLSSLRTYMETSDMKNNKTLNEVLVGLQYLHSKGLVHLELTKDTVTVSENGDVKLTGGCLPRKPKLPEKDIESVTPGWKYLAPEVLCGQMYVACADMYSFALLSLEVSNYRFQVFSDIPKVSIQTFLEYSARTLLEPAVQKLDMPPCVKETLLLCLERDMTKRPDASKMGAEFKGKPIQSKRSVVTPKAIFARRFSAKK